MNTNKIDLIKAEVEKIAKSINPFIPDEDGKNSEYEVGRLAMVTQILQYIDSLQEESKPKFKVGQTITDPTDSTFTFHINKIEDGRYIEKEDEWVLVKEADANYELAEEPLRRTKSDIESAMQEVEEKSKAFTEAHKGESSNEILAQMRGEETASEDLKEFASQYAGHHAPYDSCWQEVEDAVKAGAKWQKKQDQSIIELAEDHAMFAGMEKMREQMMKNATEVTVHIDAGGYPYTPEIELYDYDNDVPLAKEGDKYKVVLIKED